MKLLLSERVIELTDPATQVIHYNNQSFSELCEAIKQLATEPFDFAIVVNNNLANVIPFFDGTVLIDFFKELSELVSLSFYGDNFVFSNKYIEFFSLLQKELEINVYFANKKGTMRNIPDGARIKKLLDDPNRVSPSAVPNGIRELISMNAPEFFLTPFANYVPIAGQNNELFNAYNQGCWKDKEYFTYAIPNACYKLHGDLTIDYTGHYKTPIVIDNGAVFDGCGHTITLESDVVLDSLNKFKGLFNLRNGSIINLTIRVNMTNVILAIVSGFLCVSGSGSDGNGMECLIDNCHVYADLNGFFLNGLVGDQSFNNNKNSKITIRGCSFTGNINGIGCWGIVGIDGFQMNENTTITMQNNCFTGNIDAQSIVSGGMTGPRSFTQNTSCIITIQNCSSAGNINGESMRNAGVFAFLNFSFNTATTITIQNCHFTGNMYGSLHSGVFGDNNLQDNTGGSITINNCSASGEIYGTSCGGIIGSDSCDENGTTPFTIQNCYSFCNFTANATNCGGILGPDCGANTQSIIIKNCYSTGTILNQTTYAIIGNNTQNCDISNCAYNSFNNAIAGPDYLIPTNNTYTDVYGVTNIVGRTICNNPQVIYTRYECPLHPKLLDTCSYQTQNKNLNIILAFDICQPITICNILAFVINICKCKKLYIYSKDMKFKSLLHRDNNNALYNGTLASGTYIIAANRH